MSAKRMYPLLAAAVFIIAYLAPLGIRPLFVPDETRYAEIPREMLASGDWIVPHLNGLRYFEKPVLGYWLHTAALWLVGNSNFAVRLPSALAAGLTALLIFLLLAAQAKANSSPNLRPAWLASLVFLVSFAVVGIGTYALLDSLLALFLTAIMVFFYLACESRPGSFRERALLLLAGLCAGLAFLTKGFLALALPVVALLPYLFWQRRGRDMLRLAWLPLAAAIAIVLPWAILIHRREPDFWHFFFWNEHIRRFMAGNAQHSRSFWFYFLIAPAMFLPWSFALPAAISGLRRTLQEDPGQAAVIRFCLCWLVFPFLFFSAASGKLITYILPCFPPFAILATLGLVRAFDQGRRRSFQVGVTGLGLICGLLGLALILLQTLGPENLQPYSHTWKWLMVANALAVMVFFCIMAVRNREGIKKIICLAAAPVLLFFSLPFAMPDKTIEADAPGPLLQRHQRDITPRTVIIAGEEPAAAVCWHYQRNDVFILELAGELDYGLTYPDATGRLLDIAAAAELINRSRGRAVLVARGSDYERWAPALPRPDLVDGSGPRGYVFARY